MRKMLYPESHDLSDVVHAHRLTLLDTCGQHGSSLLVWVSLATMLSRPFALHLHRCASTCRVSSSREC
eukprot:scaffold10384_cov30-Tisochrysis_lutea.AAC.2